MNDAIQTTSSGFCSDHCRLLREFAAGGLFAGGLFALLAVTILFLGHAIDAGTLQVGQGGWVNVLKEMHRTLLGLLGQGTDLWSVLVVVGLAMIVLAKSLTAQSPRPGPVFLSSGVALLLLAMMSTKYASIPLAILALLNFAGLVLAVFWVRGYRWDYPETSGQASFSDVNAMLASREMEGNVIDFIGQSEPRRAQPRVDPVFGREHTSPRVAAFEAPVRREPQPSRVSPTPDPSESSAGVYGEPSFEVPTVETVVPFVSQKEVTAQTLDNTSDLHTFDEKTGDSAEQPHGEVPRGDGDVVFLKPEEDVVSESPFSAADFSLEPEEAFEVPEVEKTMVLEMPSSWLKEQVAHSPEETQAEIDGSPVLEEIEPTLVLNRPIDFDK